MARERENNPLVAAGWEMVNVRGAGGCHNQTDNDPPQTINSCLCQHPTATQLNTQSISYELPQGRGECNHFPAVSLQLWH